MKGGGGFSCARKAVARPCGIVKALVFMLTEQKSGWGTGL